MYYSSFVCISLKNYILGEFFKHLPCIGPKKREVTSQNSKYSKKIPADLDFFLHETTPNWCLERYAKFHVDTVSDEEIIPEKPRGG